VQTVQSGPSAARLRDIRAGSAYDARGRTSHDPPVVGSSSTRSTSSFTRLPGHVVDRIVSLVRCTGRFMARGLAGHVERLPGGSWRVKVVRRGHPLMGREILVSQTCKTEQAAQIELGKLLAQAAAGRQPDSAVTVAQLLD
jgi:hypothetical protein